MNLIRSARRNAALLSLSVVLAAGSAAAPPAAPAQDILLAHIDRSVNPGQDFFAYANGGWLKRNPIPATESGWGVGNLVREELNAKLRRINEEAAAAPGAAGSDRRKIGDFWATAMDEARAQRLGTGPLKAELARIAQISSVAGALDTAFAFKPLGVNAFFDLGVWQDAKNSDEMAVHLWQGGLGLPERDFYFNAEQGVARTRREYAAHITRTLKLLGRGGADAAASAARVVAFEKALAGASRKLEDLNDTQLNYHKMTPAEASATLTPLIDWRQRFSAYGLRPDTVIVGQPEYFSALNRLLARTPVEVLKDYLRFQLVTAYAEYLDRGFAQEHFSFHGRVLSGKQAQRPRWKRVLEAQGEAMGMVLGRVFVQAYFPPATKQRYERLVEAIRTAYRARIEQLEWMSPATKAQAQQKLAAMKAKVGYPEKWKDTSALVVGRRSYCDNMKSAARWHFEDMVGKFGKPVDRSEWSMTPQTYNAYYDVSNNEIVLPAAAFSVPGLADADVDDAVIYGYAGAATIGHEITHGFDDEGRKFDAAGNLADGWQPADAAEYTRRAEVMTRQFSAYEPLPGLPINGKASLGENIADFSGLLLGLDAFKQTEQFKQGLPIGGLTPLQRYFLGYALAWMEHEREARLRRALLGDVHAPPKWRVLGPLSNIPEFYEAFGIKEGQPMWRAPDAQVRIW